MKKFINEGNQIHNFISSSGSGSVTNYGSGSGFLTSYGSGSVYGSNGSGSGSGSQRCLLVFISVFAFTATLPPYFFQKFPDRPVFSSDRSNKISYD